MEISSEAGDQRLRALLAELSRQAQPERIRTIEELAATDSKLTFELTNLISRAGTYERLTPAAGMLPEGPVRYQLMNRIGQGAFGTVFHAFDRERQAHVAVKWLHRLEPDALYRFKQEFRSLADIATPISSAFMIFFSTTLPGSSRWSWSRESRFSAMCGPKRKYTLTGCVNHLALFSL